MSYNSPQPLQIFTLSGIVGTTQAATQIVSTTQTFTPLIVNLQLISTSGFVTAASLSIGTNSTSYNNILPISALTGVASANAILNFNLLAPISQVASGTGIFVNITSAAVATTYVLKVILIGI